MKQKKYHKNIDIIRLISCFFILMYHLNIIKGGYLAVCTFFVLTGYLSCASFFSKKKISLKEYYKDKLFKIYLPLVIVVFTTISLINLLPNIIWLNLKPETTSVILGYNNFWQINANLDYFTRHISSPFIHFWYIAILLQFELIFPFIFILLKKIGEKTSKIGMSYFLICISIIFASYFYIMSNNANIMTVYYGTFTILFSLVFGITLGFIKNYYKNKTILKDKKNIILIIYLCIFTLLCIFIKSDSKYFSISMIIISLISCRMIDYASITISKKLNNPDKIIKFFASITYEVYLFQYPVIFFFQEININHYLKVLLIILITFILSILLNFSLSKIKIDRRYKKSKNKVAYILKYLVLFTFIIISSFGLYTFIITKDHTKEMKNLEVELEENSRLMEKKQKEYLEKVKTEENEWQNILNNLDSGEKELQEVVSNIRIVGIGDSVMLGALNNLYERFNNGYFDAKISRTDWEANGILNSLKNNGMLGDVIVFNLGANGSCGDACRSEIINTCEDREIYWINVTNDYSVHINDTLVEMTNNHSNVHVIDWNSYSANHPEYFVADGIHLTDIGRVAYTNCIFDAIYNVYLERFNIEKERIIEEHNNLELNKYSFIGNDSLLNIYKELNDNYNDANYIIVNNDNKSINSLLKNNIDNNKLNYNIVFIFDGNINISNEEMLSLINLLDNHKIYIINISNRDFKFIKNNDLIVLDLYEIVKENNYLMADGIHLNNNGNNLLLNKIKEVLK